MEKQLQTKEDMYVRFLIKSPIKLSRFISKQRQNNLNYFSPAHGGDLGWTFDHLWKTENLINVVFLFLTTSFLYQFPRKRNVKLVGKYEHV